MGRELCGEAIYNRFQNRYPHRGNSGRDDRGKQHFETKKAQSMKLIVKLLLVLAVLALAGLTGFAYLTDLAPDQGTVTQPVILDGQ